MTNTQNRNHLIANILKMVANAIEFGLINCALTTLVIAAMEKTNASSREDAGLIFADVLGYASDAGATDWNSQVSPQHRAEALRLASESATNKQETS
jgi:hypothetical protein